MVEGIVIGGPACVLGVSGANAALPHMVAAVPYGYVAAEAQIQIDPATVAVAAALGPHQRSCRAAASTTETTADGRLLSSSARAWRDGCGRAQAVSCAPSESAMGRRRCARQSSASQRTCA
jgi:hypothetical protein